MFHFGHQDKPVRVGSELYVIDYEVSGHGAMGDKLKIVGIPPTVEDPLVLGCEVTVVSKRGCYFHYETRTGHRMVLEDTVKVLVVSKEHV